MRAEQEKLIAEFLKPHVERYQQQQARIAELGQLIEADEAAMQACYEAVRPLRNACLAQMAVIAEQEKKLAALQRQATANDTRMLTLRIKLQREKDDLAVLTKPPIEAPIVRSLPHARQPGG